MLLRILSRICRRLMGRTREREPSAKSAGESEGEERTETPPEARVEAEGQAPGARTRKTSITTGRPAQNVRSGRTAIGGRARWFTDQPAKLSSRVETCRTAALLR